MIILGIKRQMLPRCFLYAVWHIRNDLRYWVSMDACNNYLESWRKWFKSILVWFRLLGPWLMGVGLYTMLELVGIQVRGTHAQLVKIIHWIVWLIGGWQLQKKTGGRKLVKLCSDFALVCRDLMKLFWFARF